MSSFLETHSLGLVTHHFGKLADCPVGYCLVGDSHGFPLKVFSVFLWTPVYVIYESRNVCVFPMFYSFLFKFLVFNFVVSRLKKHDEVMNHPNHRQRIVLSQMNCHFCNILIYQIYSKNDIIGQNKL